MKEQTEYEIQKQRKKQQLVRNEFMRIGEHDGKYEFPIIKKQYIDLNKIEFLSYTNAKQNDTNNINKTIHFFTYDWLFEKVYTNAEEQLSLLKQYKYLLSPDFSIFTNMPLALQIESIFKNRWCGAYWQRKGLTVIPTVSWGDEKSFDFCFDGIEQGSTVAVCTYYRENCEKDFMLGYNKMLEKIKPSAIICYDEAFPSMKGNVKSFLPTTYEWTKNLSWQDKIQFNWEKHNRNVSGLNPSDFRFFKYDDPYVKDDIVKCTVCNKLAFQDQYGNGECPNCGWKFSKDENDFERKTGISYPMLVPVSRAREQFRQGKPFKATFEDFIKGMKFYSEMTFVYNGKNYGTFFYGKKELDYEDGTVEFFEDNNPESLQTYKNLTEYINKAHIGGRKIKDIWDEIESPGFMFCG